MGDRQNKKMYITNWLKEKKNRFLKSKFLVFLLGGVIIGSSIIIYYEGMPLYRYIKEGYQYSTKFMIRESTQVVPHKGGLVSAVPQERSNVSSNDIEGLITRYFGEDSQTAIAIAKAESRLHPKATNQNTNGSVDCGIFQINSIHNPTKEQCEDPEENIKLAYNIYQKSGFNPWVSYKSGSFNKFL